MTPQPITTTTRTATSPQALPGQPPLAPAVAWMTDSSPDTQAGPWAEADAGQALFGMPAERQARLAARRAFVALKLSFLYVVDSVANGADLQRQVRRAEEPHELWTLRAPVFAALTGDDPHHRRLRQLLNRSLDTMFPTSALQLN